MKNNHLNCVAEEAIERDYFRKGYMGSESATVSFAVTENDLDVILNDSEFILEAYGKQLEWELDSANMKVYFSYSEESNN